MRVVSLSLCFIWLLLLHRSTSARFSVEMAGGESRTTPTPMRENLLPVHLLNLTDTTLILPPRNDTLNGPLKNATGSTSVRFDARERERRINSEQLRDSPLHNRVLRSSDTSPVIQIGLDTWNNRLKLVTSGLVNRIPKVGFVVKALVDFFWPASKADIWTMIKDQVQDLVDAAILKRELEDRNSDISGLKQTLIMYVDARNNEKGGIMATLIGLMNQLFFKLTNSSNSHHLIPLTCTAAHLHLTLLLERQTHGNEIYQENNTLIWTRELIDQHNKYKRFFTEVFQKWKEWRSSLITAEWSWYTQFDIIPPFFTFISYGKTHDTKTGEMIYYSMFRTWVATYFQGTMLAIKLRMRRQAEADMILKTLSTTFNINAYLPGQAMAAPVVPPDFDTFVMGPYSATTMGCANSENPSREIDTYISDTYGKITQIKVRENHIVDMLQFIYAKGDGYKMGNPTGGFPHTIVPRTEAHFTGLQMAFDNRIMLAVEAHMSDNTTSGVFGNRRINGIAGWGKGTKKVAVVNVDPSYEMTGISGGAGSDSSANVGVAVIELVFRYSPHVH